MRIPPAKIAALISEGRIRPEDAPTPPAPPSKYRNQRCELEGERFDSKLERRVYQHFCDAYGVENVIRQVSFPIGNRRIRPDFLIILERFADGSFRGFLADAKGHATDAWKCRANHLRDKYGLDIRIVKK